LRQQVDRDEALVGGSLLDLLDGRLRIFLRHDDRGFQARFAITPRVDLPVVEGAGHRRRELEVHQRRHDHVEHL
jgi:hypothetical protein